MPHPTGGTEDLCIFLKLHFSVFLTRILNFSLFSPFFFTTISACPSNCRPHPIYSAAHFKPPVILVLVGCIGKGGNTEFSSPHFRELLKMCISILFPRLRKCFTSQMLKKFRQHMNLIGCWGTCVPCQHDPIALCWKPFKIYDEKREKGMISWSSTKGTQPWGGNCDCNFCSLTGLYFTQRLNNWNIDRALEKRARTSSSQRRQWKSNIFPLSLYTL